VWKPGDEILWCYRWEALPVRVVEDDARGLVVWVAPTTPILGTAMVDGRPLRARPPENRFTDARVVCLRAWVGPGVLRVALPRACHSSWLFRSPDGNGDFWGWYGNLEDPLRRSEVGVHTRDHVLDVFMDAAGGVHWKDEDELEAAIRVGRLTTGEATEIRAEGERVRASMAARDYPYDGSWLDWAPDPSWAVPELPQTLLQLVGGEPEELFPEVAPA
jgi:hypothetical protein